MEICYVIYIYFITIILTYIVLRQYKLCHGPAAILALILGQILINILKPPNDLDTEVQCIDSSIAFYTAIQLITPIIVYIYVIYKSINECKNC